MKNIFTSASQTLRLWAAKISVTLTASLILVSCTSSPYKTNPLQDKPVQCLFTRAALDIGSGETKLKVARVNVCISQIEAILLESKRDVNFKEDLQHSKNSTFSDSILEAGRKALIELKIEAMAFKPEEYTSVATSAFRDSKNAQPYIEKLNLELGLKIQIISQQEEGVLGFYSARSKVAQMDPEKSLVWDIGGGSQQMIIQAEKKKSKQYSVYEGKLASTSFKNYITEKIQKTSKSTPNPLMRNQYNLALVHAQNIAAKTVKNEFKQAIQNKYTVYGIGGVHNYSLKGQIQTDSTYTPEDVVKVIENRLGKTDEELGNATHVATDTSNPILVLGFMKALGINKVQVVKVNLADGLLINHKYWTP